MAQKITYDIDANTNKIEKDFKDVGKAADKMGDTIDNASKSTKKLENSADKAKQGFNSLGSIIKGGLGLGIVLKLFDAFASALMQNEELAKLFQAAMNVLTGVINGVVEVIKPAIEWMKKLFKDPKGWWEDLVNSLKKGGEFIKTNLIDLVLNKFVEWANNAKISILELRKAWNEFTGDTEEANAIQKRIDELNKQNIELAKANAEKITNIKEVVKDVTDFVEKAVEKIAKAVKKVTDNQDFLESYERNLGALQRKLQEISAQAEIDAEKQRQIRDDDSKSMEERIAANEKLAAILKKGSIDETKAQEAIANHMQTNVDILGKNADKERAIADERLKVKEIENKYAGQQSEQLTNINSLKKEQLDIEKSLADTKVESLQIERDSAAESILIESEKIKFMMDSQKMIYDIKVKNIADELALNKEGTARYQEILNEKLTLDSEYSSSVKENTKNLNKALKDEDEQRLMAIKGAFDGIKALTKENSKANIAAQIGSAIIDTFVGANKALASAPPPFNFVAAGAVVAAGIANIKKITEQAKKMGADTGGGDIAAQGGSIGPSIGIVGGQMNSANQLTNSINDAITRPSRSYVVSSDVSSQQGLDRRISQNATLGG